MLASDPIQSDTTFHFLSLQSVGDHSHVQRTDEGGLGDAVTLLGAAALVVIGYVIGGVATSGTVASTADAPLPVDIGGGAAKVKPATVAPADVRARRPGRRRVPPRPRQRPGRPASSAWRSRHPRRASSASPRAISSRPASPSGSTRRLSGTGDVRDPAPVRHPPGRRIRVRRSPRRPRARSPASAQERPGQQPATRALSTIRAMFARPTRRR